MANKNLFQSASSLPPVTDTVNEAGGVAYKRSALEALTQYAVTGCLNDTYYVSGATQLDTIFQLTQEVSPEYIAKLAVYARTHGYMKDMPALLLAILSKPENKALLETVFGRVIDNGKMLRNYVQILRSGTTGRKALGTLPKRLVTQWLLNANIYQILQASVGNAPSLADVIKMVHPKPNTREQSALFAWLLGNASEEDYKVLPDLVKQLLAFRENMELEQPHVPFELLTSLPLTKEHWKQIAKTASWQMLRMNLNTFLRNGVLEDKAICEDVARRLQDAETIKKVRVFPYQCLTAYKFVNDDMPMTIKLALQTALDFSLENIPNIDGKVAVLLDVSGSMSSPVTGDRGSATTKISCLQVAAMVAAALLRKNPETIVIPFATEVHAVQLNPRDSVATLTDILVKFGGGGTNCGIAMQRLNKLNTTFDMVIMISDNESWIGSAKRQVWVRNASGAGQQFVPSLVMQEWKTLKQRNKRAKLVCIDLTPDTTVQAPSADKDIINIGGFSDNVFNILAAFAEDKWTPKFWVDTVEGVKI